MHCKRHVMLVLHCSDSFGVLYCIVLYCIVLYCIVLYCIVLYCIVLYCIVLYCIVLYCIVLYYIVLYCIVLYCIVLYCIVLYCIVLYCIEQLSVYRSIYWSNCALMDHQKAQHVEYYCVANRCCNWSFRNSYEYRRHHSSGSIRVWSIPFIMWLKC